MKARPRWWPSVFAGFAVLSSFVGSYVVTSHRFSVEPSRASHDLPNRPQSGTELLAIFVGSSTCGASEYPGLRQAIDRIRSQLRADAARDEKLFVSVGVALDQDPSLGIRFLEEFGTFDEIMAGGGWMNAGSLAFIVRDFPGRRAIPQLILIERNVTIDASSIATVEDRLMSRKVGSEAIVEFADLLDELARTSMD